MRGKMQRMGCVILVLWIFCMGLCAGCGSEKAAEGALREVEPEEEEGREGHETSEMSEGQEKTPDIIYVHVCGEVVSPGVYKLPAGSRMYEALDAAGGMTEKAAALCLNQAELLSDGQQVRVLSEEEERSLAAGAASPGAASADDGKVNLNTASKEELMTLNGIGEARAEAILKYREEHGGFSSAAELKEVDGIKDGVFSKVEAYIKIA